MKKLNNQLLCSAAGGAITNHKLCEGDIDRRLMDCHNQYKGDAKNLREVCDKMENEVRQRCN